VVFEKKEALRGANWRRIRELD